MREQMIVDTFHGHLNNLFASNHINLSGVFKIFKTPVSSFKSPGEESLTKRQALHNRLPQPIIIVYHFNPIFLAHNLHIPPLPVSPRTGNDSLSWYPRTETKLEQTDRRLGSWMEVNDDNVRPIQLLELPFHLLTIGSKIGVLAPRAIPISAVRIVDRDGHVGEGGG